MKKILLFLVFLATFFNMQAQNTAYANRMQYIFGNIDKTKVTTGYLKEFGVRFANIEACNGALNTSNYVTPKEWNALYNSLYSMRVGTVAQNMMAPSVVNTNLKTAQNNSIDILIAVQHYNYQQYKTNAYTNGDVIITNDKIYDVAGRNPYDSKTLFAITPLKQNLQGSNFTFKLPSNLIYSNVGHTISQITVDFSNGQGYQNVAVNEVKNISYTSGGEKTIKVKFQYTNGTIVESHSKILIDYINPTPNSQARFNGFGSDMFWVNHAVTGNNWNGSAATGLVTIELAPGHTQLTKPLIIIEGFDPENSFNYLDLVNEDGPGGLRVRISENGQPLLTLNQAIEDEDYDLVFINFVNSTDYIQRNAYMVEEVIRQINQLKVGNEKNVVLGMSMGGLVGRYALRDMEINGETHETKLYISHDSPHQGANVPLAAQALVRHLVGEQISLPVFFSLFNVNIADLEDNVDGLSDGLALLQSPAAQQMLIYQLQGTGAGISVNNSSLNSSFLSEYRTMGYPQQNNIRNIAIANGSECGNTLNFEPYTDIINANVEVDLPFFLTNIALAVVNGISINPIKLVSSLLSTNTDVKAQFTVKALPSLQAKQIYRGRIYIRKTILFLITVNEPLINEKTINSTASMLALDNSNGGIYDIETFAEIPTQFAQYVIQRRFNFIPIYSSLDIGRGNVTILPTDLVKQYSPLMPPPAPKNVPFNNFFTNSRASEAHIQFTRNNGDWLKNELANNPTISSCLNFCTNAQIIGSDYLCNSGTYSVTNEANPANTIWNITEGSNLVNFTVNGNQITLNQTGQNGFVTISVTYGSAKCGSVTNPIIKRIWAGIPQYFSQQITNGYDNVPINSSSTLNLLPIQGAQEYYWWIIENSNSCGCITNSDGLTLCPAGTIKPKFTANNNTYSYTSTSPNVNINWGNCSGNYIVNVAAKNPCGLQGINYKAVNVYSTSGGGGGENPCEGQLAIYPNPVNESNSSTGEFEVNIVYPGDPCDDYPEFPGRNGNVNQVKIYDFYGNLVHSQEYNSDQMKISDINLKRGNYILNVFTSKGFSKREIIVVK